jgi:hypothetical protein
VVVELSTNKKKKTLNHASSKRMTSFQRITRNVSFVLTLSLEKNKATRRMMMTQKVKQRLLPLTQKLQIFVVAVVVRYGAILINEATPVLWNNRKETKMVYWSFLW